MNNQLLGTAYAAQLAQLANRLKLSQREAEERVIRGAVIQALKK